MIETLVRGVELELAESRLEQAEWAEAARWLKALQRMAKDGCVMRYQGRGYPKGYTCRHECEQIKAENAEKSPWYVGTELERKIVDGSLWCYGCQAQEALRVPMEAT